LLHDGDVVVASRNVYGGTYQLLHDWFARPDKLNVNLAWFDGYSGDEFQDFLANVENRYREQLAAGKRLVVYLESPCNPFGYVLDIPAICTAAHEAGHLVVHDSTIGTPFLSRPLQREDKRERPDFVIHSYTKDLTGNGNATAGVVIGENHRMFQPKGESALGVAWNETLFWGVYYIKGAFLDSDKAFEVISGMKTLEGRMLQKCFNTLVLTRWLDTHPQITVNCNALAGHPNGAIREKVMAHGFPAPLFTIDFESADLPKEVFIRFFDSLSPGLDHQVSLGQSNTVCLCPAYTSHSELDETALEEAGIRPTTIRIAVGLEDPKEILAHFRNALRLAVDPVKPGFSEAFPDPTTTDRMVRDIYMEVHASHADGFIPMASLDPS
jgi:cystathionine beta-lyase/cystathionine gamma-synthase